MALRLAARGSQIPASFIQPRNVSHGTSSPWRSSSFSRAKVGPKSAYCSRTIARMCSRKASGRRWLPILPRFLDIKPAGPWVL
jgi:hypothetical protein